MNRYRHWKRWLAAGVVVSSLLLAVFVINNLQGSGDKDDSPAKRGAKAKDADTKDPGAKGGEAWVMFGGNPTRNFQNEHAKDLPVEWSVEEGEHKNVVWSADLGSKAYGGPVVSGGRVFIGTNNQKPRDKKWVKDGKPIDLGIVMAFDQAKGTFLYQTVFTKLPGGRVVDWPEEGICSTPVVEGEKIYYVSNRCEVICAKVENGEIIWKLDMIGKLGVFPHNIAACSPLLVGDHLWVVTANGVDEGHINVPAPRAPSFIKVAKADGKVLWEFNGPTIQLTKEAKGDDEKAFFKRLVNRGDLIQHGQWSNPAHAKVNGKDQYIFPGGDGWIYSFDENGKLLWRFDCNPKDAQYELSGRGTRSDFIATPVIYKDRVYIGVGQDPEHETGVGHLWCIDMTKGSDKVTDVSPEIVVDNTVFPPKTKPNPDSAMIWHYGGYTTPEDFKKLRRKYYFGRTMSTCAIKDDILYVSEILGIVHCLDANTGKPFWTHDSGAAVWSSPYWADNKVYLGTDGGTVVVFQHGKKKNILAENDMQGRVRATPVAVGDTLYVMTENRLWALRNKKE